MRNQQSRSTPNTHQSQGQLGGRFSTQQVQQDQVARQQAQRQPVQSAQRQATQAQPQRLTAAQVAARRAALQRRAEAESEINVRGATYQR